MLKLTLAGFATVAVLFVGGQTDEAAIKKERARFKGTWKVVKVLNDKGEEEDFKGAELTFDESGGLELSHNGEAKKGTYKLNPTSKPKEIDIVPNDNDGKAIKGIYQFEKKDLKLCVDANPDGTRPTEFGVKDNTRQKLVTLERVK